MERLDKRKKEETRPIEAKAGVIPKADGSAYFKIGDTAAYAAVYGPRQLYPKFLQDPKKGILRVNYNMMPFSGDGERVRPGPSRRSKEISLVTEKALLPVLNLEDFPNAVVDVFVELPETDAGSRCAAVCAASIALADAGIPMRELVAAVSFGKIDNELVVDLSGEEEHLNDNETPDVPVAMIPSTGEITLLQMDGVMSKEEILEGLKMIKPVMQEIVEIEKQALKEKYKSVSEEVDNHE